MNSREAREILKTYRPGVDWTDAAFHEALEVAKRDPELAAWVREQGLVYDAIRTSLRSVPVPEGLAADILARHRRPRPHPVRNFLQIAAAVAVLLSVAVFWLKDWRRPTASFPDYRASMTALVSKKYPMSLESPDPALVRKFLANNQSPADYVLPSALRGTPLLGCATLSWGSNPVSLLCFRKPNGDDLWLFVTEPVAMQGAPASTAPEFAEARGLTTASWQAGGKVYLLSSRGGANELTPYLPE
jgi:hypothetical protein